MANSESFSFVCLWCIFIGVHTCTAHSHTHTSYKQFVIHGGVCVCKTDVCIFQKKCFSSARLHKEMFSCLLRSREKSSREKNWRGKKKGICNCINLCQIKFVMLLLGLLTEVEGRFNQACGKGSAAPPMFSWAEQVNVFIGNEEEL